MSNNVGWKVTGGIVVGVALLIILCFCGTGVYWYTKCGDAASKAANASFCD